MKNENIKKELMIGIFKLITITLNYLIFALVFSTLGTELLKFGRLSILTLFIYLLTIVLLLPVFGGFDIGNRKSKPVIYSTAVVYLVSLMAVFLAQMIMTAKLDSFTSVFITGVPLMLLTYILQVVALYVLTHLGNSFYFSLFKPSRTLIVYDNEDFLEKIQGYVTSHNKQFDLIDTVKYDNIENLEYKSYSTIFLVGVDSKLIDRIQENCFNESIDLFYTATVSDIIFGKSKSSVVDDILMIESRAVKLSLFQLFSKRAIDIIFSLVFLILTSPIFILIAIAIKLDDGGKVFYQQERLTLNNRVFKIIKFRSMIENAGSNLATVNDSRITRVGNVLRKFRIDELPQFLNILKGDMSVVGPRPESKIIFDEIKDTVPEFEYRLKVKAGLTGYAQIFGKYNTTSKQKLILDLKYIVNYSVINDLKLILQTSTVFYDAENSTEGIENLN